MQQAVCASCGRVALLQPGETRPCPSCGNSLSAPQAAAADEQTQRLPGPALAAQDDGTTRPIDPAALPPPPSAASSSQPQSQGGATPAAVSGSTPLWPRDPTTQALPADYAPPPPTPTPTPTSEVSQPGAAVAQKRSRAPLVFSMLALVLLLVLVSVGGVLASAHVFPFPFANVPATPTAAPTLPPTATPPPGYLLYRDVQGFFEIYYPAEWTAKPAAAQGGTGVALTKPNSTVAMAILQVPISGTPTMRQLLENQFQELAQGGAVSNQQQLADGTVGGTTWAQGSVDWLPKQHGAVTVKEHLVVLATVRNGHAFVIELLEPPGNVTSADEATLQTMLASFTFV